MCLAIFALRTVRVKAFRALVCGDTMVAILLRVNDQSSQCVGHCLERDEIFLVSTPFGRPFDLTNLKVGDLVVYEHDAAGVGRLAEVAGGKRPCYVQTALAIKESLKIAS